MAVTFTHDITYTVEGVATVDEVVRSLLANKALLEDTKDLLEGCFNGLKVESVDVTIRSVSQESPLREMFFVALVIAFQSDLETEVPPLIEALLEVDIPDSYDSIITVSALAIAFFGADFLFKRLNPGKVPRHIKRQLDLLISEVATSMNVPEERVRRVLENKYRERRNFRWVRNSVDLFLPAKKEPTATVVAKGNPLDAQAVHEVPASADASDLDMPETSVQLEDVLIELSQHDRDRRKLGWSGVIKDISDARIRMQVFPPIRPQELFTAREIRGDGILISKQKEDGSYRPDVFHLVRVRSIDGSDVC